MDSKEAIKLITKVVDGAILATGEGMTKRGVTKRTIKEVDQSVSELFRHLVGRNPTKAELSKITD